MKKKWVVSGLAAMFLAGAAVAFAQPSAGPGGCCREGGRGPGAGRMYDASREITVIGEVTAVEHIASRGRMQQGQGAGLTLKTGDETVFVHLGPQWYLDRQSGVKIAAGDKVEIRGAKAFRRGEEVFIAAEVKKGQDILKLRDDNGYPAWAGSRIGGNQ